MLSSPLLFSPLLPQRKSLQPISIRRLPTSKNANLICGFASDRRIRVSYSKKMTPEAVRLDNFESRKGVREVELGEAEEILGDGSSEFGRDVALIGFESTLNRLSKWLVAVLFGLVILGKHDAESMWAAMGAVVNSWLSITLKQILNQQRPSSALRSDPGMPSSHAQSILYTAVFALLALIQWKGVNTLTVTVGIITLICGSYLSWLRVSQQLHTISQVVVGAALGSACSIGWFWLWHSFVLGAFISSLWVRIIVILGAVTFCASFLLYVIQHWLDDR